MTVRELIDLLNTMDPDLPVILAPDGYTQALDQVEEIPNDGVYIYT